MISSKPIQQLFVSTIVACFLCLPLVASPPVKDLRATNPPEYYAVPSNVPNLLIVVAEGLGWGDLHCYGSVNTRTPNADRLAYEGSRFTQFQMPGPGYFGNQYTLLTGRLASRTGLVR